MNRPTRIDGTTRVMYTAARRGRPDAVVRDAWSTLRRFVKLLAVGGVILSAGTVTGQTGGDGINRVDPLGNVRTASGSRPWAGARPVGDASRGSALATPLPILRQFGSSTHSGFSGGSSGFGSSGLRGAGVSTFGLGSGGGMGVSPYGLGMSDYMRSLNTVRGFQSGSGGALGTLSLGGGFGSGLLFTGTRRGNPGRPTRSVGPSVPLLERPQVLLTAYALNAPLYRSSVFTGQVPPPRLNPVFAFGASPSGAPGSQVTDGARMASFLSQRVVEAYRAAQARGWGLFQQAQYRQAAFVFDEVLAVNRQDTVARVGMIFAQTAQERYIQAGFHLGQWLRLRANPFVVSIDIRSLFASEEAYARWRDQFRRHVESSSGNDEVEALWAFSLWYTGDRQGALTVARAIRRRRADSPFVVFVDWMQASMRAAEAGANSGDRTPDSTAPGGTRTPDSSGAADGSSLPPKP